MPRILLIRLSALGDIVMASGLLGALKAHWPQAHITWVAEPAGASIIQAHPLVDEVVVWPRVRAGKNFGSTLQAVRRLRERSFDLAIDLQGLARSALPLVCARANQRWGVRSKEGSQWLVESVIEPPAQQLPPMGREYRATLTALGLASDAYRVETPLCPSAASEVTDWLKTHDISSPPIVLVPCTTRPQKHWFNEHWASVAQQANDAGHPIVVLGGPHDGPTAEEIARLASPAPVISAAGSQRSLLFAFALLRRAAGVIGVDTALTHAAIGAVTPTVALFGSTHPYLDPGETRARVLWWGLDCAPCRRRPTCNGAFTCMRLHTPERVWATLQSLMKVAP